MKWNQTIIFVGALVFGCNLNAGQIDGNAVLGSAIGAAVGSAVGSAAGGKEGAVIGGGIGGAIGAAAGSNDRSVQPSGRVIVDQRVVSGQNVMIVDDRRNNGKHKGHYKNKHHYKHGRD